MTTIAIPPATCAPGAPTIQWDMDRNGLHEAPLGPHPWLPDTTDLYLIVDPFISARGIRWAIETAGRSGLKACLLAFGREWMGTADTIEQAKDRAVAAYDSLMNLPLWALRDQPTVTRPEDS